MQLTTEQKMAIGAEFTDLAKRIKSSLDSMAYAAPEMQQGWRTRIWADIGDSCGNVIDILESEPEEVQAQP